MTLFSVGQTANQTGLSAMSIRRMIARGDLPSVRIGRRVLVAAKDLENFIQARRREGYPLGASPAEGGDGDGSDSPCAR